MKYELSTTVEPELITTEILAFPSKPSRNKNYSDPINGNVGGGCDISQLSNHHTTRSRASTSATSDPGGK